MGLYQYTNTIANNREVNARKEQKTGQNVSGAKLADPALSVASVVFTTYKGVVAANARQALNGFVTFEKVLAEAGHHSVDWIG